MQIIPENILVAARQAAGYFINDHEENERTGYLQYVCHMYGCIEDAETVRQLGEWMATELKRRNLAEFQHTRKPAPKAPEIGTTFDT